MVERRYRYVRESELRRMLIDHAVLDELMERLGVRGDARKLGPEQKLVKIRQRITASSESQVFERLSEELSQLHRLWPESRDPWGAHVSKEDMEAAVAKWLRQRECRAWSGFDPKFGWVFGEAKNGSCEYAVALRSEWKGTQAFLGGVAEYQARARHVCLACSPAIACKFEDATAERGGLKQALRTPGYGLLLVDGKGIEQCLEPKWRVVPMAELVAMTRQLRATARPEIRHLAHRVWSDRESAILLLVDAAFRKGVLTAELPCTELVDVPESDAQTCEREFISKRNALFRGGSANLTLGQPTVMNCSLVPEEPHYVTEIHCAACKHAVCLCGACACRRFRCSGRVSQQPVSARRALSLVWVMGGKFNQRPSSTAPAPTLRKHHKARSTGRQLPGAPKRARTPVFDSDFPSPVTYDWYGEAHPPRAVLTGMRGQSKRR